MARPPKYNTPQEMQEAIDAYFMEIDLYNAENAPNYKPYTVTGLAMAIDLTRQGLIDYLDRNDGEFIDTIKKAKSKVERFNEEQLYRNAQVAGVIFNLKNNFDWKDKSEVDNNIGGQANGIPIMTAKLEGEQLTALLTKINDEL